MDALQQQAEKTDAIRKSIVEIFDTAGGYEKLSSDQVEEVRRLNTELEAESKEQERLAEVAGIAEKTRSGLRKSKEVVNPYGFDNEKSAQDIAEAKTLGELFVTSDAYKHNIRDGRVLNKNFGFLLEDMNVKTLISEAGTGFAPQVIRTGLVVPSAQQMPALIDTIPSVTTDQVGIKYMLETTYTSGAAEVAEDGTYGESALGYTEENQPVQKLGTSIPVTDEQLADIPGMRDRINNRLILQVRQRLDSQLANGNGSAPNLLGLPNVSGVNTYARAASEADTDAIMKGMTKVRTVGFANPTHVWMNPNDWQNIQLMRTSDGIYIWGNPGSEIAPRVWGLPVVASTYVTQGTCYVADFTTYTEIAYRAGLEFEITNSHGTDFLSGVQRIRCQLRAAFVVYRPSAATIISNLQ